MKVYLAGPMSGYPEHNFPAFHSAAADLRSRGIDVVSPAECEGEQESKSWADWMRRDLQLISEVDAIACLPGWEKSKGARLETHIACELGMPLFCAITGADLQPLRSLDQLLSEVCEWADATFPNSSPRAKVNHLHREVCELIENPSDGSEMADVVIITAHLACGQGIDLKTAIAEKFEIVKGRTWGAPDADGVIEHVREGVSE